MEKMLRIPLAVMVSVLSVFLVAGGANAGCRADAYPHTIFNCGDVVTESCTLTSSMFCATRHGLIIGASGITIDGDGYKLSGNVTAINARHCAVNTSLHHGINAFWCNDHPCRSAADTVCRGGAALGECCIDSGILNARGTDRHGALVGGCNDNAPACQGGCSDVTIKNLEIKDWCDGIFVSGDCDTDGNGMDGDERKLTGLLIEKNSIHDNGNPDCGTFIQESTGDGGDWTNDYYNDGIFTAQIGMADFDCSCEGANQFPAERNIIQDNIIYNQNGCATVSCPGGSGINVQGGLEEPEDGSDIEWGNCNDIRRNKCVGCAMSGIQFHHAIKYNRIRQNNVASNEFGGIANGCGWCTENYILSNIAIDNKGCGIAARAEKTMFANNKCFNNVEITDPEYLKMDDFEPASHGVGIMADSSSDVSCNISLDNAGNDIDASSTTAFGDNICQSGSCAHVCPNYYSSCAFGNYNRCEADLDGDCKVHLLDFGILSGEWTNGLDPTKPQCCPCP